MPEDDPLTALEKRLIGRITMAQETIIERMRDSNRALDAMNTNLELITTLLTDLVRRVTDLERP
jgi:guanylate kinase